MKETNKMIRINDVEEAKKLVSAAMKCPFDIDIIAKGKFSIDAKSILGVLSLGVEEPLELKYDGFDENFEAVVAVNICTFLVYGIDKQRARSGRWRIPESRLLLLAAVGGSLGAWMGMYVFHHKTKKAKFYLGIPLILFIQCALTFILER